MEWNTKHYNTKKIGCYKFNRYKFGKNYSKSKCFIHIWGGASIKYKMNRYGLFDKNITNDIDIVIVPFENNPDIRIKLINILSKHSYIMSSKNVCNYIQLTGILLYCIE
jgi:hypothetical protein